jgi:hypothetical protein
MNFLGQHFRKGVVGRRIDGCNGRDHDMNFSPRYQTLNRDVDHDKSQGSSNEVSLNFTPPQVSNVFPLKKAIVCCTIKDQLCVFMSC